jgi:hypothetical protein
VIFINWYGNVNEPRDTSGNPEKSSLFFLTVMKGAIPQILKDNLGIGSPGDKVRRLGKCFSF